MQNEESLKVTQWPSSPKNISNANEDNSDR